VRGKGNVFGVGLCWMGFSVWGTFEVWLLCLNLCNQVALDADQTQDLETESGDVVTGMLSFASTYTSTTHAVVSCCRASSLSSIRCPLRTCNPRREFSCLVL
jgi:hypothetical protein